MRLRTVIIEDERKSLFLLEEYLEAYEGNIEIVGKARSAHEGFATIRKTKPDLVFLDISMPGGSGLDLLDRFSNREFEIIFLTAHSDHALEAIRRSAIHYLLKPLDLNDLDEAIHRALEKFRGKENWINSGKKEKITIPTQNGYQVIKINQIVRCEADGSYTSVVLSDGNKVTVSHNLKTFEIQLTSHNFLRVHRSHLISLSKVQSFTRGKGSAVTMDDGYEVDVSNNKRAEFLRYMKDSSISEIT